MLLTPEEKEKILYIFNDTAVNYPGKETFDRLFTDQASATPGRIAVTFGSEQLTYAQLEARSNRLAHQLLTLGAKYESLIAICMDRSIEMVTGILGILKAGAAYVPIDPDYPSERIKFMLDDSGATILLSNTITAAKLSETLEQRSDLHTVLLDSEWDKTNDLPETVPDVVVKPDNLAYVIYTSGSTGKPKGVLNEHAGLVNRLKWTQSFFNLTPDDVVLQKTTYCFDVSVWELLWPLMVGARLVLAQPGGQKDNSYIRSVIEKEQVTTIHFVPSMLELFLADLQPGSCQSLKRVLCSGEALTKNQIAVFWQKLQHSDLFNLYGPTEAAIDVSCWPVPENPEKVLIGKPVANTSLYVLDEAMNPVPIGERGELYIGGIQVARSYLNRPELNATRFIPNPFIPHSRMYRTGDYACWHPDGTIEYLERTDDQVKIRGFRIETGEIETLILQFPGIKQCVVHAREDVPGEKRLVAYLVSKPGGYDLNELLTYLKANLPDYMIPAAFVELSRIPLTGNGKTDRKALPKPEVKRPELTVLYRAPASNTEKLLAGLWTSILQIDKAGINDNFFDLGGNSLLALRFVALLKQQHNLDLPVTRLYRHPTIHAIAAFLEGKEQSALHRPKKYLTKNGDIAVIGMSGRFPGANSIEELWDLLREGKESIRFFSDAELDPGIPETVRNDPAYVKARGVIDGADQFDANFFGINPRLAELMDPQQRIFLEIAWEALERAGYLPQKYDGSIGVFAGAGTNTYFVNNVLTRPDLVSKIGSFQVSTVNEKDYIATRAAYELNLKGPAVSVYSACSTSLLAIVQAVDSLRKGQCDVALAGAVSVTSPVNSGHIYEEGAMLSKDGHCKAFDANAQGTVFSDGAGVVLLKNKEEAEQDGDTIYAIIKGTGLNNDGAGKASFTAPDPYGQAGAITMALEDAGVTASSISYVEAHGTGTPLGDPIEIEGLKIAFGPQDKKQFCAIGSIKSNMGHLTQAAGVAGFIKTVLSLYHKQLPPSVSYSTPNPDIDFVNSPFFVNSTFTEWDSATVRRAGVSSFGVGGTNVHVILEEALQPEIQPAPDNKPQLICWSAKTETSLNKYAKRLGGFLKKNKNSSLSEIGFSLLSTRHDFNHRRFIIASDTEDLITKTETGNSSKTNVIHEAATEVAFMFPGQGSQYLNMGLGLYKQEPVFRNAVDECAGLLSPWLKEDIRQIIYPSTTDDKTKEKLKDTRFIQPALFVTEYAMAKLWMHWGIQPSALTGHSIGEFVAAHLAGIFTLKDVLMVVAERARMISNLPGGSMLAVKTDAANIKKLLPANLSLAAINSPHVCVLSGTTEAISDFQKLLSEQGIPGILLHTSHAFHSAMMDAVREPFLELVKTVKLNPPRIPLVSTVTGRWMSDAEATSPDYWADQLRVPVRFADALHTLTEDQNRLLLEVGPGNTATLLARQQGRGKTITAISSFENKGNSASEYTDVLEAAGRLWQNGISADWKMIYATDKRRTDIPNYAFDHQRFWVEPGVPALPFVQEVVPEATEIAETLGTKPDLSRKEILIRKVKTLLEEISGISMEGIAPGMSFIEIGLDSLLMTQAAIMLKREFNAPITFRRLNEEFNTPDLLAEFLDSVLPAEVPETDHISAGAIATGNTSEQIQQLIKQLNTLQGADAGLVHKVRSLLSEVQKPAALTLSPEEETEVKKPFGATPRIEKQSSELNTRQLAFLSAFTKRYNLKTGKSKAYTAQHRPYMADPRVVSGFRPATKEITYPIVVKRSAGSRLWDLDGNEYIDALNGFGSNMLGYQPEFIKEAIKEQIEKGYEIGPQHELAGDVCKLVCEFTGFDRAALCSTGSEAVLGTMRIARTVTGRSLIVAFSGSYHGIFDEVIIRGTKTFRSIPAAPGIMPEAVRNMLILDYGTEESLTIIRERAHELAAVLAEPVQSRRPEFLPVGFLKTLRNITENSGTALIFDEVITGFRMHPGGTQAIFGIQADIASYGKVAGGGIPIGVIAGRKYWMDALDGGSWQFGDTSGPEAGVTYFAGTFVRHPLALAAAKASLTYLKEKGPSLQEELNYKTFRLVSSLNNTCKKLRIPLHVVSYGSMWKLKFKNEIPYSELLFTLMREKGIHILDGFPCFVTEAHTDNDLEAISSAFGESATELIAAGFLFPNAGDSAIFAKFRTDEPPVAGAKLGRDREGNPAWFIADPKQPGKYMQIEL